MSSWPEEHWIQTPFRACVPGSPPPATVLQLGPQGTNFHLEVALRRDTRRPRSRTGWSEDVRGMRGGGGSGVGVAFLPVPQEAGSRPLGTQHAWSSGGDACGLPCAVLGCGLEGPIPRGTATSAPGSRQLGWRSSCWQRDVRRGVRPLCTCARRWGGDSQWSSGEGLRFRRGEERRRKCGVIRAKVTCEPWDRGAGGRQRGCGWDPGLV